MKSRLTNILLGSILTLLLILQFSFRDHAFVNKSEQPENAYLPVVPDQLSFAGEAVPLDRWEVKERLDRELLYNYYSTATMLYLLKLSNRNFPVISARLKANGVPDDFKYLCIAESNMQSWAVSKAGAVGYWQFLDGTAKGYGLQTGDQVDQRMDLERSTDAACKYLKQAFDKFGSWTAAAASYNCGMGGYNGQADFQRTRNYYDLHLPEETNKYIFRILSFKYIMEHAKEMGLSIDDKDRYQQVPVRTIQVQTTIPDLAAFAISQGSTYKMLRVLNPWIRGRSLSVPSGKTYQVLLPEKKSSAF
jgi:membrane-bound lytic murein transglycosylase D